jgi:hypothetical protein
VARLLFTCPNTSRKASTGVEMDLQGLRQYWKLTLKLDCPHCDDVHDVRVREAYVDSAVEGLEPTGLQRAMARRDDDRLRRSAAPGVIEETPDQRRSSSIGASRPADEHRAFLEKGPASS